MRKTMWAVLIAAALAAATSNGQTQQQPVKADRAEVDRAFRALDAQSREIVETYLRTDCEIGEVGVNLKALVALGDRVKDYLTAVERQGPPSPVVDQFSQGLAESWKARQSFLETKEARALGEKLFAMMRAITREKYEKDQQAGLQAKYRERASLGLRALANPGKTYR
ncbi:MAG TPA: hypothetical protein VHR45_20215 [Thermoanaerobaculia bacterium]|nr:hypothetical protein [Thermoanaerobaculia bacterium]